MMTFLTIGLLICQVSVLSQAEKFGIHFPIKTIKSHDKDLAALPTRYHSNQDYPEQDFPNYNKITRREFDLPVTFKAPHYEARDYWRNTPDYYNRRTFFQDFSFSPHDRTTPFAGFYQFKTSIFAGKDEITPEPPETFHYNRNRVTPPYSFDIPFHYRPTEPNYIPPPKPIRASVIKLETITSSPIHPSFEYETSKKYFPHVETILKQALIENSNAQHNLRSHPQEPLKVPPFKPLPVLPKPKYILQTTLKPTYSRFFNNKTQIFHENLNETDYKYPESVQDQLPHLNEDEVKIPYVSEKPIPRTFNTLSTESPPIRQFTYIEDYFPHSESSSTTDTLELIDIRSFIPPGINTERRENPNRNLNGIKFRFDTTTTKSFPGAVEKVKRPTFKYIKKLTAQLDKNSIERVANLTVQGFSKIANENFNSHSHFNHFKVNDLIKYEMGSLVNTSRSASSTKQTLINNSSMKPVNLNDELSLDAKILKDTNWDGLTAPPTSTTTEEAKETTTLLIMQPKQNRTAFWEIKEEQNVTPTTTSEAITEPTITTTQSQPQTSAEFILGPSKSAVTETSDFFTEKETTTRRVVQERAQKDFNEKSFKLVTENPETFETTNLPEKMTPRKKYSRRPKIVNFTPYPTVEELQKKLINRNHFPKRQKPNITLAFGNKNVLKNQQNQEKDEVIKFSDEGVRKRRKTGKRRQVFKRIRVSTSERPVQKDHL